MPVSFFFTECFFWLLRQELSSSLALHSTFGNKAKRLGQCRLELSVFIPFIGCNPSHGSAAEILILLDCPALWLLPFVLVIFQVNLLCLTLSVPISSTLSRFECPAFIMPSSIVASGERASVQQEFYHDDEGEFAPLGCKWLLRLFGIASLSKEEVDKQLTALRSLRRHQGSQIPSDMSASFHVQSSSLVYSGWAQQDGQRRNPVLLPKKG